MLTLPTSPPVSEPVASPPEIEAQPLGQTLATELETDELLPAEEPVSTGLAPLQEGSLHAPEDGLTEEAENISAQELAVIAALEPDVPHVPPEGMQYTLQPGDVLIQVARRFDTDWQTLLEANSLTEEEARSLQAGQEIFIPGPPRGGSTFIVDAPALTSPEDEATFEGAEAEIVLRWEAVEGAQEGDVYVLHAGWATEDDTVRWEVMERLSDLEWRVPSSWYEKASAEAGSKYYWYVQVQRPNDEGKFRAIGPPTPTRTFLWR